ncbi:unnamed protein product [Lathyrus sativus]|nr:unnamed protein product [Lathyrus sativus]
MCRSFLWAGANKLFKKYPMTWKKVCSPKIKGRLNIVNLEIWNKACLIKLLWNLHGKSDTMWIKWIHYYYVKDQDIWSMAVKNNSLWVMKSILKLRNIVISRNEWNNMVQTTKFQTTKVYDRISENVQEVSWRRILYQNMARPRALFTLWMAYHRKLATKDRLARFWMLNHYTYCFCNDKETIDHLFFQCRTMKTIWKNILEWMLIDYTSGDWIQKVKWVSDMSKSKASKMKILKCGLAETVYEL